MVSNESMFIRNYISSDLPLWKEMDEQEAEVQKEEIENARKQHNFDNLVNEKMKTLLLTQKQELGLIKFTWVVIASGLLEAGGLIVGTSKSIKDHEICKIDSSQCIKDSLFLYYISFWLLILPVSLAILGACAASKGVSYKYRHKIKDETDRAKIVAESSATDELLKKLYPQRYTRIKSKITTINEHIKKSGSNVKELRAAKVHFKSLINHQN